MKLRVKGSWNSWIPFQRKRMPEFIGIIGTGRGIGVTHFAIMTAGYLCGVKRLRCAVLEWNGHSAFGSMGTACSGKKQGENSFRILETDYFEKAGIDTLLLCKKSDYQTVIVDYGTVTEGNLEEFYRCGRQFLIGSLSEWQINEFLDFERRERKVDKGWDTLVSFGSEEARKNLEKKLREPVGRIPFATDPFSVTAETIRFYEQLF